MISRGYTWLDENIEHSDEEATRAAALARRWSTLETQREERQFRRQSDIEDFGFAGPEPCEECRECLANNYDQCVRIAEFSKRQADQFADEQLEIEIIEVKLAEIGARMMRPYEHHNEDERLMEYLENRNDY